MPIVTRKAFAELCGDDILKINKWIQRGKIVLTAETKKLINTDDPVNASFIADRKVANAVKNAGEPAVKTTEPNVKVAKSGKEKPVSVTKIPKNVTKTPAKPAEKPAKVVKKHHLKPEKIVAPAPQPKENAEIFAISRAKMDQQMQKTALEIENLELSKQQKLLFLNKNAGELLPVDLVKGVVKRHADVILKSFENDFVKMATVFCNIMAGGDQSMLVRVIRESKEILSQSIARAGLQADEEMVILIKDFSKKLERGQRRT